MTRARPAPVMRAREINKVFGATHALQGRRLHGHGGARDGALRRERRRQVDADEDPRRDRDRRRRGRSSSTASRSCSTGPRDAAGRGIAIIHQELSLFPNLSIADNIFMARERAPAGLMVDRAAQREVTTSLLERLDEPLDPDAHGRRPARRSAADRRDRARALRGRAGADHGRADLGAQRRRGRRAVPRHPRPHGARRRRSSTSPTTSKRRSRSPTTSSSSATGSWSPRPRPPRSTRAGSSRRWSAAIPTSSSRASTRRSASRCSWSSLVVADPRTRPAGGRRRVAHRPRRRDRRPLRPDGRGAHRAARDARRPDPAGERHGDARRPAARPRLDRRADRARRHARARGPPARRPRPVDVGRREPDAREPRRASSAGSGSRATGSAARSSG